MGLEDVAKLLTTDSNTQRNILNLLTILNTRQMTFEELRDESGLKERYLRFLITKLRSFRLLIGERFGQDYTYFLSHASFSTYLKSKYMDAIYNLTRRPRTEKRF